MTTLIPIDNNTNGSLWEEHTLDIPPCCPVSKNPQSATITIGYRPVGKSLEVANLLAYIYSFQGGLKDECGVIVVRDMEGMVTRICSDCERVLGVPVKVATTWVVLPRQTVHLCSVEAAS
jgi:NADPH-dependent 7-cyano-7-deazaguanine reductase QueF